MTTNVQVQAAAYALRTFTVRELAAYANVTPRTVQAILRRAPSVYERVSRETSPGGRGRGRPAQVWRLADPDALMVKLRTLTTTSGVRDLNTQTSTYPPNELAWDLLATAEAQLLGRRERGDQAGRTDRLRAALAATEAIVQDKVRFRSPIGRSAQGGDEELYARSELAYQMATRELASTQVNHWYADDNIAGENLKLYAAKLVEMAPALSAEAIGIYWKALSRQAEDIYNMPPLSFVTATHTNITSLYPQLGQVSWSRHVDDSLNLITWTPSWAEPFAVAGLVCEVPFGQNSDFSRHYLELTGGGRSALATTVALSVSGSEWDFRVAAESGYALVLRDWGLASVLNACRSAITTPATGGINAWHESSRLPNADTERVGMTKNPLLRPGNFRFSNEIESQPPPSNTGLETSAQSHNRGQSPRLFDGLASGLIRWYNPGLKCGMVTIHDVDLYFDSDAISGFAGPPQGDELVEVETEAAVLRALRPYTAPESPLSASEPGDISRHSPADPDPPARTVRTQRPRETQPKGGLGDSLLATPQEVSRGVPPQQDDVDEALVLLAEHHSSNLVKPGQTGSNSREWMVAESSRLTDALAQYVSTNQMSYAYRVGAALGRFWWTRDYRSGWDTLTMLVEQERPEEFNEHRSAVVAWRGRIGMRLEHIDAAGRDFTEVHNYALATADTLLEAEALNDLSVWASWGNSANRSAEQLSRRAIGLFGHIQGRRSTQGRADGLDNLGTILSKLGQPEKAEAVYLESLALYEELGDSQLAAWVHIDLARLFVNVTDHPKSTFHARRALTVAKSLEDVGMKAYAYQALGRSALHKGKRKDAGHLFDKAIKLARKVENFRLRDEVYGERNRMEPVAMSWLPIDDDSQGPALNVRMNSPSE